MAEKNNEVSEIFLKAVMGLSDSIKKAEEIEISKPEAEKLNSEIKNFIDVSNKLLPILKNYPAYNKVESMISNIVDAFENHFQKLIETENEQLIKLSNKVFDNIKNKVKDEFKTVISKSEDIKVDQTKIVDKFVSNIDQIKNNLLEQVYVKKSFTLVSNEEIAARIDSLAKYFKKGK